MDTAFAQALAGSLREDRCIFGYSGLFPDEHSARLIKLGESVLEGHGSAASVRGRLGYVLVEAYQNVVRHRADPSTLPEWGPGRGLFMLRCRATGQHVVAFNTVSRSRAEKLDNRLTELGSKTKLELKALYMRSIQRASDPGTRGAGLGLIEMVRRSVSTPDWAFTPIDEGHMLFGLTLELGEVEKHADPPAEDQKLRHLMLEHEVKVCYVGHWSAAVKEVLLGIVSKESQAGDEESRARAEAFGETEQSVVAAMGGEGPVVLVLQGKERTVLSIGGVMEGAKVDQLRDLAQETNVSQVATRDGRGMLAMVHVPW